MSVSPPAAVRPALAHARRYRGISPLRGRPGPQTGQSPATRSRRFRAHGGPDLQEILAEETETDPPATPPTNSQSAAVQQESSLEKSLEGPAGTAGDGQGIYLAGRPAHLLTEFFARLRDCMYYPPRGGSLELRDILREQIYHLARVIEARDPDYRPFVPA